jgi:tryptophan synthase alpha chain
MSAIPGIPGEPIGNAIRRTHAKGNPALVAYLTAGYPSKALFTEHLQAIASAADVVEIGVPFTDPMADGVTIQRSSQAALQQGVSLRWILSQLMDMPKPAAPLLLMSYLNPLLAFGFDALAARAAEVGVSGIIGPDLPHEEAGPLRAALQPHGLALVQLVTPATPPERLRTLCAASEGFVYAVTRAGITGSAALPADLADYLARVKKATHLPVCAGFGVRRADQVALIAKHADGVIVGSALVEVLERREDPAKFLAALRG